jgi:hypothetical protein
MQMYQQRQLDPNELEALDAEAGKTRQSGIAL